LDVLLLSVSLAQDNREERGMNALAL